MIPVGSRICLNQEGPQLPGLARPCMKVWMSERWVDGYEKKGSCALALEAALVGF